MTQIRCHGFRKISGSQPVDSGTPLSNHYHKQVGEECQPFQGRKTSEMLEVSAFFRGKRKNRAENLPGSDRVQSTLMAPTVIGGIAAGAMGLGEAAAAVLFAALLGLSAGLRAGFAVPAAVLAASLGISAGLLA